MTTDQDDEVQAILAGDDDPLEKRVVGLPPLGATPTTFTYPSSFFGGPDTRTPEERAADARRYSRKEALNHALRLAKALKWDAATTVAAAESFAAYLEAGE